MKKAKGRYSLLRFWTDEAVLLIASVFFAFVLVGYRTIALVFFAIALLKGIYRFIFIYSQKNEKKAKNVKTVLTSLVVLGLAVFTAAEIPVIRSAHTDKNPEAPYLIVLGAGVNGTEPSLSLLNRLEAAKEYLEKYPQAVAVVSGGQGPGEDISEAECMKRWLYSKGIPEERIIMEDKSFSTEENIANSLAKIDEHGGNADSPVAIVSSEYHLYRAKYIAREKGAEPLGVAAHTSYPVLMANYFIREAFAVLYMWIM